MAKKSLRNTQLFIKDAAAANSMEVVIGEGNVTWSESQTIEYTLNRGLISSGTTSLGDDVPMEVSFDFTFEYYVGVTASGNPTIQEALRGVDEASTWSTSDTTDACAPYSVDLEVQTNFGTCAGGAEYVEHIEFPFFRWESGSFDVGAGSGSFSGKCRAISPTVTRNATTTLL